MRAVGPCSDADPRHTNHHDRKFPRQKAGIELERTNAAHKSIDIVVPDIHLASGAKVLLAEIPALAPCPNTALCPASSPTRPSPAPDFHVHIRGSDAEVSLYRQSEALWFLAPLSPSLASPEDEDIKLPPAFVFASDQTELPPRRPGRGSGYFKPGLYPVIIPRSHTLLEALMRLHARDEGTRAGAFSLSMIGYVEMYVDPDGFLSLELLPEVIRAFYTRLRDEDRVPLRRWTEELRAALKGPA
ncbi:MAG: hypothetical protein M1829_001973 [Trizodia sp. TS-e1964]|nr:MAG: hypothetical protein M1829_001973 [Trizodia sp. TS-e1964]